MGNQPQKNVNAPHYDRLETLLKNLPGMAYRCLNLPHWPMDFVSEGCFALCGYHRHEIESQQVLWGDFTHPDMIDYVDQKVRTAAERGEPFEVEYRIISRDGVEKWVWERGRVVDFRDDGVAILEGFINDITDRKLAEKEAREQRELLAHADRLNTLGEMAAGIAHEINQPLTAISMYAQSCIRLLNKSTDHPELISEGLEKLSAQAHRAGAVIERMQQLTRRRESENETVDCAVLVEEVSNLAEVEARLLNFSIVTDVEKNLSAIKCDPVQIQQVMLNLLRNGMEAMRCVNAEDSSRKNKQITLQARTANQPGIEISIVDTGGGISEELAQQLYQPFTSTKESGMGLGLSISRSIIAAHGSELTFTNNNVGGTTFSFVLPLADS